MKIKTVLASLFFLAAVTITCGTSDQTYTIETIEGVKHIHNHAPLWGDEPRIKLEFVKEIGDKESDDENYYLFRPSDIGRDAGGNYYVLEQTVNQIKVFDSDGKYKMTIGRKGQGPGEIGAATRIAVSVEGNIYVPDQRNGRIQVFAPDGKDLGSTRFNTSPIPPPFRLLSTGEIVHEKIIRRPLSGIRSGLVQITDLAGNPFREFAELNDIDEKLLDKARKILIAVDSVDNIYTAFRYLNRVEKYTSSGKLIFRADRPLNYETGSLKMRKIRALDGSIRETYLMNTISQSIEVDSRGRIWILSWLRELKDFENPSDREVLSSLFEFHVFDPNGIFLGVIPVESVVDKFRISGDRLFIIDMLDEMCVYEYKIVEK